MHVISRTGLVDFYSIVNELGRGKRPIGEEPRARGLKASW
jgi:hypothetical protein